MKWLTFWAADKDMKLEMISSGAPIRASDFIYCHLFRFSSQLDLTKPCPFCFYLNPLSDVSGADSAPADVQKDWQNENEIMEKKMRLINITSLTVICLALRTPLVWQLIYSWWHYKNVFSFVALSVVNLVSFSRQSPLQGADELAASKEVSNAWAAVIARIISSAIWVS